MKPSDIAILLLYGVKSQNENILKTYRFPKYEIKNTRSKIRDQKMETIKWKVV